MHLTLSLIFGLVDILFASMLIEASRKLLALRKCPPPSSDLIPFEKDLLDMATSLKFRHVKDSSQRELSEDIRKIKISPNVFIFANKTNNICVSKCQKTITRNFYMMLPKPIKRHHPD